MYTQQTSPYLKVIKSDCGLICADSDVLQYTQDCTPVSHQACITNTIYTHTLSHKFTQCANADMLDKPAHSNCSHVVHNRALLTQYRCSYQNTTSPQECSAATLCQQAPSPCSKRAIQHSRYMLQIALQGTPPCQCDTHVCTYAQYSAD